MTNLQRLLKEWKTNKSLYFKRDWKPAIRASFDSHDKALRALDRAAKALEFYGGKSHWSETYKGGPRLSFSGLEGEGFEAANEAIKEIEDILK